MVQHAGVVKTSKKKKKQKKEEGGDGRTGKNKKKGRSFSLRREGEHVSANI